METFKNNFVTAAYLPAVAGSERPAPRFGAPGGRGMVANWELEEQLRDVGSRLQSPPEDANAVLNLPESCHCVSFLDLHRIV
ncbi:hypothetical protein ABZP36_023515 [Zizania latifolia]